MPPLTRREFLLTAGGALVAAGCGGGGAPPVDAPPTPEVLPPPPRGPNRITVENARPGASAWDLQQGATAHEIEGYALRQSVVAGEPIEVAVSARGGPLPFRWTLYRVGHYGGAGAREVATGDGVAPEAAPPVLDRRTGLVTCGWSPTFRVATGADWVGGIYLLKLVRSDGYDTWVPLVLRDAQPSGEVLLVVPTATWQAYNPYGGESLYRDDAACTGRGRAFQVSFDRPYGIEYGAGFALRWDGRIARFLEAQGEDVAYAADEDVDRDPAVVARARAVVVSGHAEYWSRGVREAMDAAVAGGTSLLLFGANAGYWQIRYAAAAAGGDRRIIACYKDDALRLDPAGAASRDLTVRFRDAPLGRPENALFGVMFRNWNTFAFPMNVADGGHWAFAGTGLATGDALPGIGGYEVDDTFQNAATPAGVEVLAECAFLPIYGEALSRGRMVVRQEGAALVFAAGGIDFASALAGDGADPRVQRLAANVVARALGRDLPRAVVTTGDSPAAAQGPFARDVRTVAGLAFSPGDADGPAGVARLRQPVAVAALPDGSFAVLDLAAGALRRVDAAGAVTTLPGPALLAPTGIAADAAGNLYVADTGAACIRRRSAGGAWSVLAGAPGALGSRTGPGATARFMAPAGLAVAGAALYVADTGADAVRRVDLADGVATVSAVGPPVVQVTGVTAAADGTVHAIEGGEKRLVRLSAARWEAVAGGKAGFADGPAARARLLPQLGLVALPGGGVAFSDAGNRRVRLVRAGAVSTLAGSERAGAADGPGDQAGLALPAGLALDAQGRLLVADVAASVVRRIALP